MKTSKKSKPQRKIKTETIDTTITTTTIITTPMIPRMTYYLMIAFFIYMCVFSVYDFSTTTMKNSKQYHMIIFYLGIATIYLFLAILLFMYSLMPIYLEAILLYMWLLVWLFWGLSTHKFK